MPIVNCVSGLGWLRILCCTSSGFIGKTTCPRDKMKGCHWYELDSQLTIAIYNFLYLDCFIVA